MTVAENYVNFAPPFFFYQLPIMTVLLSAEERRESINRKFWQVGKKNAQQRNSTTCSHV